MSIPNPGKRSDSAGVLHIINGEYYSGAERVQDLLALRLPEFGFHVGFACLKPVRFPEAMQTRESALFGLPMRSKLDLRPAWRLARIIRQSGYRIVHAHTPRTAMIGWLTAALARVPWVYHVHSPASRDTTSRWVNRINALVERWSLAGASRVIAVSESLGRHMEPRVGRGRIRVVHNGVPAVSPTPSRCPPGSAWTLGTVALFRPRKGTETLLDAMALLKQQGLPVRLRAVGPFENAEYETALKTRAADLGLSECVEWTGFIHDVGSQWDGMDLFVLPSLFGEGLPMVVLEAMAGGVPVVATEVEGVPEAVLDGQTGLLVPPGDPQRLTGAIARVVRGEVNWSEFRTRALARHAERFSDRAMASGVAAVYRELLGAASGT